MIVYVSGPLETSGDYMHNIKTAIDAADKLLSMGHTPYVPHLNGFWHMLHPRTRIGWLQLDMSFIKVCDAILRLPGDSLGADAEVERAIQLDKLVYYNMEELK